MPIPNPRALGGRRRTVHLDDLDDLRKLLGTMRDHAESIGRTRPIDVFFPALVGARSEGLDLAAHKTYLAELEAIGVTWALAPVGGRDLGALIDAITRYGRDIIRKENP